MAMPKPTGPPPAAKRRHREKPASYGLAEPVQAGAAGVQPTLGFKAHRMVSAMWRSLGSSVEGQFFSDADWQRARWELWHANKLFNGEIDLTPTAWAAVQRGLSELLVSAADKRRAGIELKAAAVDPDETAAVLQMAKYQDALST